MISIIMVFRIIDPAFRELWDVTTRCINSLMATPDVDYELIVIDNGSHDATYAESLHTYALLWKKMQFAHFMGFRQLRFNEVVPLAKAWNEGIHQADGDWLMLANNDIVFFEAPWMSRMIEPFSWPDRKIGVVGIQHMSWYKFAFVEGSLFVIPASFREEFNISDDEDRAEIFDDQFTLSCEDVDFNHRVQMAGYEVIQVNDPPLQPRFLQHLGHRTVSTLQGTRENYIKLSHQNRVRLCEKWGFPPQIVD